MKDVIGTALASPSLIVVLTALWKTPDWVHKWLDVRDRLRDRS